MFWRCLLLLPFVGLLAFLPSRAAPPASPLPAGSPSAGSSPSPTFEKEGVAFLQKHCVACHNEKTKRADVSLHFLKTPEDLLKHRKLV
ncbi:MAG: hypothetical protein SNJ82_09175, partial [Gemmataceae bacterium]